jgi:alkylation response protein AidB-like acyl-CoA dehydrogenase
VYLVRPLPQFELCTSIPRELSKLLSEVAPSYAEAIDRDNAIPSRLLEELRASGFFAVGVPREYGGLGLGVPGLACVARAVARYSIPLASVAVIHGGVAVAVAELAPSSVRGRLLPPMARGDAIAAVSITERRGGSDLSAVEASYVEEAGGFRVTGEKVFTSNALYASIFTVLARNRDRPSELSMLLVERGEGVRVEPMDLTCFRGAGIGRVVYANAYTGRDMVLGELGAGLRVALHLINVGRVLYASIALGAVEGLLEATLEYASTHQLFGQKLIEFQAPRWSLARIYMEALTLSYALSKILEDARQGRLDPIEAAVVKVKATELAVQASQVAARLHGGRGLRRGALVERMLRDTQALTIGEGANEVLVDYVSRKALA